jgi:UDP-glucose 4-epimerase
MIVLSGKTDSNTQHVIIVFGEGLLGSAIVRSLMVGKKFSFYRIKINWENPDSLHTTLSSYLKFSHLQSLRLDWVWSAGKSGFNTSENDITSELQSFARWVEEIKEIEEKLIDVDSVFHLLSSAGGLFEGQRVDSYSIPAPLRPYGWLKLYQEQLVIREFPRRNFIYRISSAYGNFKKGHRSGLISTLVRNTYANFLTNIHGNGETLRDYVFAEDIGKFLADVILKKSIGEKILFLVSSRPVSVFEVIYTIELITGHRPFISFDSGGNNLLSNSFDKSLLPINWNPTDVQLGIRLIDSSLFRKICF